MKPSFKRFYFLFLMLLCLCLSNTWQLQAQNNDYWQQEVHYDIEVSLDDEAHELNAFLRLNYINHSPDDLAELYFHLWPNAFKGQGSAFAKQQLEGGSTEFYFSKKADRGFIDQIAFQVDGQDITWAYDANEPDIAKLTLNEKLASGDSILITTPFKVKIPETFSRLGHVGQSYQITQWYPKPAVYDHKGWHPMPYLSQGEFYSEYGSFDVRITLPKNYVVGATGDLESEEERAWLLQKVAKTEQIETYEDDTEFPASAASTKTLRYTQNNIHDFAWFADKRFHVLHGEVELASGKKVDTWSMYTNEEAKLWAKSIPYLNRSIKFYSEKVGEYPYNQVTAVQSALSAGAGMEYPNVTVIGISRTNHLLETVMVHEVGHNWFYGQLGSNERDHAWMDEGINSYYEKRYFKEYYPGRKLVGRFAQMSLAKTFDLSQYKAKEEAQLGYLLTARTNDDQPIDLKSDKYRSINYGAIVYGKAATAFAYMEAWLGQREFDRIMKKYYQQYEFKHPYPEDLKQLFEEETGKYMDWFFEDMIFTNKKTDYKIASVKRRAEKIGKREFDKIIVKQNFKHIKGPFPISAIKDGEVIKTVWYDGFQGEMEVLMPSTDYNYLMIDIGEYIPEINRKNNKYTPGKMFKTMPPLRLQPFASLENPRRTQIFFSPIMGYNYYDKFMLGMGFYNSLLPRSNFEYTLAPMYAFGSKSFSGSATMAYSWYPNKALKSIKLSMAASTYGSGFYSTYLKANVPPEEKLQTQDAIKFYRFAPALELVLKEKDARSKVRRAFTIRHVNILRDEFACPDTELLNCVSGVPFSEQNYYVNEAAFDMSNKRRINPYDFNVTMRQADGMLFTKMEGEYLFSYAGGENSGLKVRAYAGGFLQHDLEPGQSPYLLATTSTGARDYMLDGIALARYEATATTLLARQIVNTMGGFKLPSSIGLSDKYLLALNISSSVPILPVKIYADMGIAEPSVENLFAGTNEVLFDAGLALILVPNVAEVYFPLFHSETYRTAFKANGTKWHQKITFLFDFHALNPIERVRGFSF